MSDTTLMTSLPSRPHLVGVVRERIRLEHCDIRAEAADALWIKCHILFHDKRNLGTTERSERAPCPLEHDLPSVFAAACFEAMESVYLRGGGKCGSGLGVDDRAHALAEQIDRRCGRRTGLNGLVVTVAIGFA